MSYPRFLAHLTLGSCLALACGGSFTADEKGGSGSGGQAGGTGKGGSGASAGTGGSGRGGSAGAGGDSCEYNGAVYEDGEMFSSGDGCNSCICNDGEVGCTAIACPEPGCAVAGAFYAVGDSWSDGCNTCSCERPGEWLCTQIACPECSDIGTVYSQVIEEARACNPDLPGQCSQLMHVGLQCGCESFVNPENANAIAAAKNLSDQFVEQACGENVLCGACLPPSSSYCSAEGRCVDVWDSDPGAACKVGDTVYPSGSNNVPHPFSSCNTCTCVDGQLDCTNDVCPFQMCAPGMVEGSQCVQCGAGGCEVVEHGCLPTCDGDDCLEGACVSGVCKALCG